MTITDRLTVLCGAVANLRRDVAKEGKAADPRWHPHIHCLEAAARLLNHAHHLAVRHRDLWPLQDELMPHGLSSLDRLDGRRWSRPRPSRLAGKTAATLPWTPSDRHFRRGWRRPRANTGILFGVAQGGRWARILVTLPSEAATNPRCSLDMIHRGVEVVRIECTYAPHRGTVLHHE
jgi:pyruvate kinase